MRLSTTIFALLLASMSAAQNFRVAGIVVDSETGAPLSRTRVALANASVKEQSLITTANGKFSFDVPKGKYTLLASHRDWVLGFGQMSPYREVESNIIVGPDQDTTELVFRWYAPGAIHGKVIDDSGDPVQGAAVELFLETVFAGEQHLTSLGRVESDEDGNYRWSSLAAGTYYLAATGKPWYYSDMAAKTQLTQAGNPPSPYALTYYPGSTDARAASPVTLRPGGDLEADFRMRTVTGATLHAVCPNDENCSGALILYAIGLGGVETLAGTAYLPGSDTIPALMPGRYIARFSNGAAGGMRKTIDIGAGEVTIEVAPKPVPTLTGKVTFQNPDDPPRHPIFVNLLNEDSGERQTAILEAESNFSWPEVPVARTRLSLSGEDGFFVAQFSVEGATVKDGVIDIVDGATVHVNLVASNETGGIKGLVLNGDKPLPAVMVVLAPAEAPANPERYFGFQTDSDGSFDYSTVPPGDYVLFASDNLELEYANPQVVRPYLAKGKRVRIEPHNIQTANISPTPAPSK